MKKHLPSPSSLDRRNHVIRRILENVKTHAESREFRLHGNGLQFESDLFFKEEATNADLAPYSVKWNVEQGNAKDARSYSSRLLSQAGERIRGIDPHSPGATFCYRKETESAAFWHENQIYFDDAGLIQNRHEPLTDWPERFPGPNAFARKVATRWNIETWRDGEEPSLFNLDEVSP